MGNRVSLPDHRRKACPSIAPPSVPAAGPFRVPRWQPRQTRYWDGCKGPSHLERHAISVTNHCCYRCSWVKQLGGELQGENTVWPLALGELDPTQGRLSGIMLEIALN